MSSARDIRRRIKSVKNTQKITKAMEMVSAAKLRRATVRLDNTRPYAKEMISTTQRLLEMVEELDHPLTAERPIHKVGLFIVTSDKGLCGAYNANVFKMAERHMATYPKGTQFCIVAIGKRSTAYFKRRGVKVLESFSGLDQTLNEGEIRHLTNLAINLFVDEKVDQVDLIYAQYVSAMINTPTAIQMLPLHPHTDGTVEHDHSNTVDFIFEPSVEELLGIVIPRYLRMMVVAALAESFASEHGARMVAMRSATDAAKDMIGSLTLSYNRARQSAITKEINEIVGGAEALK